MLHPNSTASTNHIDSVSIACPYFYFSILFPCRALPARLPGLFAFRSLSLRRLGVDFDRGAFCWAAMSRSRTSFVSLVVLRWAELSKQAVFNVFNSLQCFFLKFLSEKRLESLDLAMPLTRFPIEFVDGLCVSFDIWCTVAAIHVAPCCLCI